MSVWQFSVQPTEPRVIHLRQCGSLHVNMSVSWSYCQPPQSLWFVYMFESHFFQKYIFLFYYNEKGLILLSEKKNIFVHLKSLSIHKKAF